MKASEKLLSLTNIDGCASASEHFCSITNTGGDINYIIRNPLVGDLQFIYIQKGLLNHFKPINGLIKKDNYLLGKINKIEKIKGIVGNDTKLKGKLKC